MSSALRQTAAPQARRSGNAWEDVGDADEPDYNGSLTQFRKQSVPEATKTNGNTGGASALQSNVIAQETVTQILEKEFMALKKLVDIHHANALKLVEQHCGDATGSSIQSYGAVPASMSDLSVAQTASMDEVTQLESDEPRGGKGLFTSGTGRMTELRSKHEKAQHAKDQARQNAKASKALKAAGGEHEESSHSKQKAVFADAQEMKQRVKEAIIKPEYNVVNFYKTEGIWQKMARTEFFDNLTLFVIACNSIWIAVDTDVNDAATLLDAHIVFQIGENLFCIFFSAELFIRFMAFDRKRDCLRDGWFVFDSMLVSIMVGETWIVNAIFFIVNGGAGGEGLGNTSVLSLVRLLRLTRMTRMVRLLRVMPELLILIKGIWVAARSVFFTLVLLVIIIYIFAIAFTQLADDTPLADGLFPGIFGSMSTLLLVGALPDQADFVVELGDQSMFLAGLGLIFILLSTLTVLNMLIGVLCEVVSVVSAVEKEQMAVNYVKSKLLEIIDKNDVDQDGNRCISKEEFEALLLMPEGARIIEEVGVDVVGLVDFMDDIFKDGPELSFPDVMELVLQLRSQNQATVRDVIELRKLISNLITSESKIMMEEIIPLLHQVYADLAALKRHSLGEHKASISIEPIDDNVDDNQAPATKNNHNHPQEHCPQSGFMLNQPTPLIQSPSPTGTNSREITHSSSLIPRQGGELRPVSVESVRGKADTPWALA
jgi:hypothetical protein